MISFGLVALVHYVAATCNNQRFNTHILHIHNDLSHRRRTVWFLTKCTVAVSHRWFRSSMQVIDITTFGSGTKPDTAPPMEHGITPYVTNRSCWACHTFHLKFVIAFINKARQMNILGRRESHYYNKPLAGFVDCLLLSIFPQVQLFKVRRNWYLSSKRLNDRHFSTLPMS